MMEISSSRCGSGDGVSPLPHLRPWPFQEDAVQACLTRYDEGVNTALEAWKKIDAVGFTKLYTFVREAVKREPTPADRRQLFINLQARSFLFALQHEVDREGVMMRKLTKADSLFDLVRGSSLQDIEKLYLDHLLGIVVEENLSPDFRSRYHAKLQELLHPNEEVAA